MSCLFSQDCEHSRWPTWRSHSFTWFVLQTLQSVRWVYRYSIVQLYHMEYIKRVSFLGISLWPIICSKFKKQESPPAWAQEAYRPQRIKYSMLSYPGDRGGYLPWQGVGTLGYPLPPRPDLAGGGGVPTLAGREAGTLGYPFPHPELAGGVGILGYPSPILTWLGRYLHWPGGRYLRVPTTSWPGWGYLSWSGGRYLGVPPTPILT